MDDVAIARFLRCGFGRPLLGARDVGETAGSHRHWSLYVSCHTGGLLSSQREREGGGWGDARPCLGLPVFLWRRRLAQWHWCR
eukprot:1193351-Prorocentrum_minimum.AAC.5